MEQKIVTGEDGFRYAANEEKLRALQDAYDFFQHYLDPIVPRQIEQVGPVFSSAGFTVKSLQELLNHYAALASPEGTITEMMMLPDQDDQESGVMDGWFSIAVTAIDFTEDDHLPRFLQVLGKVDEIDFRNRDDGEYVQVDVCVKGVWRRVDAG